MKKKILSAILAVCLIAMTFAGCSSDNSSKSSNNTPAETTKTEEPLKVALVVSDTIESVYNRAMYSSLMILKDQGYNFELNYIENVTLDNATSVLRTYADSGYDVVICHAAVSRDATYAIHKEYPNTAFIGGGFNRETPAPNVGAYDQTLHEGSYLLGVVAGMMTKSNVIGFVASKPQGNVTSLVNAYKLGAEAVNPGVKVLISYIESYYDPIKAKECTNAQIAQGADIVFGERDGVIQACQEAGIYAMMEKIDQSEIAPETVLGCAVIRWENTMRDVFDDVKAGTFKNQYYTRYEGAFTDGTCALELSKTITIPQNVQDKVADVKNQLISGNLVVPFQP